MKRRAFLAGLGATTAAAALWPSLIRRAFADASFDAPGTKKTAPGLSTSQKRIDTSVRRSSSSSCPPTTRRSIGAAR